MNHELGSPRIVALARESLAAARRAKVSTALVAVLIAAVCATTLATVGRADAAEQQVATRMDSAGARELRVSDVSGTLISPAVMTQVRGLSLVQDGVGIGSSFDVTNARTGQGGTAVPATEITKGLDAVASLQQGREPRDGEALVTREAMLDLGMEQPFGAVTTSEGVTYSVVGSFVPREPFDEASGVVINAPEEPTRTLVVIAHQASEAALTQRLVLQLIGSSDPSALRVQSPVTLAEVRDEVVGDLQAFSYGLLLVVLAAGAVLVTAVVLADTLMRRVDLGRRRALGAPRWSLVVLVVSRTLIAASMGAAIGVAATFAALHQLGWSLDWKFGVATGVLAVLAAGTGSLLPATVSAFQDPVRVLRTP